MLRDLFIAGAREGPAGLVTVLAKAGFLLPVAVGGWVALLEQRDAVALSLTYGELALVSLGAWVLLQVAHHAPGCKGRR